MPDLKKKNQEGKKTTKRYNWKQCCVYNCTSDYREARRNNITYYSFPALNQEQRELWRQAVCQYHPKGQDWYPKYYSRICALHFVGHQKSPTRNHPSYVPTIFNLSSLSVTSSSKSTRSKGKRKKAKSRPEPFDYVEMETDPLALSFTEEVASQTDAYEVLPDVPVGFMFCERIGGEVEFSVSTQTILPKPRPAFV